MMNHDERTSNCSQGSSGNMFQAKMRKLPFYCNLFRLLFSYCGVTQTWCRKDVVITLRLHPLSQSALIQWRSIKPQ